jgi:hypothetical protein
VVGLKLEAWCGPAFRVRRPQAGKASLMMNGKFLGVALVAAVVIAFLFSASFFPGVGIVMLIALVGVVALGSYVRHDRTKGRRGHGVIH